MNRRSFLTGTVAAPIGIAAGVSVAPAEARGVLRPSAHLPVRGTTVEQRYFIVGERVLDEAWLAEALRSAFEKARDESIKAMYRSVMRGDFP